MVAKDAAVCSVRDTRTVAEDAARVGTVQRREMHTMPERVKPVPEWMEIVAENMPAGIAWRRPCCNAGCYHDAGDRSHKRAASGNDLRTTHDITALSIQTQNDWQRYGQTDDWFVGFRLSLDQCVSGAARQL